jgi:hypothetical protein
MSEQDEQPEPEPTVVAELSITAEAEVVHPDGSVD